MTRRRLAILLALAAVLAYVLRRGLPWDDELVADGVANPAFELSATEPCPVCGRLDWLRHLTSFGWLTKEDADDFYPELTARVPADGTFVERCAYGTRLVELAELSS